MTKISNYVRPGAAALNSPSTPGNIAPSRPGTLDDLTDVSVPSPVDGDVLTWNDYLQEWEAAAPTGGGALADLTDVDLYGLGDGDLLQWDALLGLWVPGSATGVADILDLPTAETDTTKRLAPDGAGGVAWGTGGGGGGALVLLEQHTASNSATLDFTTAITSTYDDYIIDMIHVIPVTDQVGLQMLASTDGGANWLGGTSYAYNMDRMNYGTHYTQASAAASSIPVDGYASVLAGNTVAYGGISGTVHLYNPRSAASHKMMTVDDAYRAYEGTLIRIEGSAGIYTTSAVDALRFQFSSGNISSGTVRMYGIAKS